MNETLQVIKTRRSVKKYKSTPVEKHLIDEIVQAGLCAPSGLNSQKTIILAVTNKEIRDKLSALNAGKDPFKRSDPFYGAPTAVVVLADGENRFWLQDGSLVMGNLMTAAASLGVASCWINRATEYFDSPAGKEQLKKWNLPETLRGVGTCILGYADGPAPAPKPRKEGYIVRP